LSILDLLFCTGPEAPAHLLQCIRAGGQYNWKLYLPRLISFIWFDLR
jgi:hypothetical protein